MDYKKDILSVETFLENRPDLSVHSDDSIRSAIYSSASLLNGETNGNIEAVWNYNHDDDRQTTNPLYRTDYELSQIVEAMIVQTQYTLNIGNDYSIGGGSYSIGNINSSFNRPESRDIIAPGVIRLLQNARVYQTQSYFNDITTSDCDDCVNYDSDYITRNIGDMRYVQKQQSVSLNGYIAQIDMNGMVSWVKTTAIGVPTDLAEQLNNIKLGISNNDKNITNTTNDFNSFKDSVTKNLVPVVSQNVKSINGLNTRTIDNSNQIGDLTAKHNSDITRLSNEYTTVNSKVDNIITALKAGKFIHIETDNVDWDSTHSYSIGALAVYGGKIWFSKVNNNLNNVPTNDSQYWQIFSETDIDLSNYPTKNEVNELLKDYVKLTDFENRLKDYYVKLEIDNMLAAKANTSDLSNYVLTDTFNESQQVQDDKYRALKSQVDSIETGKVMGVKVDTFEMETPIENKELIGINENNLNNLVTLDTNQTITAAKSFDNSIDLINKNRLNIYSLTTANSPNLSMYIGQNDNNGYIEARSGNLILSGNNISANNKKIINVATPTNSTDGANKAYVDSKSITNYVTLDTTQTISGSKTFSSGQTNFQKDGNNISFQIKNFSDSGNNYGGLFIYNGSNIILKFEAGQNSGVPSLKTDGTNNLIIKNLANPTESSQAATKQYVDNQTVTNYVTTNTAQEIGGTKAFTSPLSMRNNKIINLGTPTSANDGANKAYVDNKVSGFATTSSVTTAINNAVSGLASTTYVDNVVSDKATTSYVDTQVSGLLKQTTITLDKFANSQSPTFYNSAGDKYEFAANITQWGISGLTNQNQIVNVILKRPYWTEDWRRAISLTWCYDNNSSYLDCFLTRPKTGNNDWDGYFKNTMSVVIIWK